MSICYIYVDTWLNKDMTKAQNRLKNGLVHELSQFFWHHSAIVAALYHSSPNNRCIRVAWSHQSKVVMPQYYHRYYYSYTAFQTFICVSVVKD